MAEVYVNLYGLDGGPVERTHCAPGGADVDYDADGRVIGYEFLGVHRVEIDGVVVHPAADVDPASALSALAVLGQAKGVPGDAWHMLPDDAVSLLARRWRAQYIDRSEWRCWGVSSDTLALFAVGVLDDIPEMNYPADRGDLDACERTYAMASHRMQKRMQPMMQRLRAHVNVRYPEGGVS